MYNKIRLFFIAIFAIVSLAARSQGSTPLNLTAQQAQLSIQFKQLVGQDRLSIFQQLQGIIKSKSAAVYDTSIVSFTDLSQVISLFGNADEQVAPTVYVYHLNNAVGKKQIAVISVDSAGQVLYCSLSDAD